MAIRNARLGTALSAIALLAACGGGGGGSRTSSAPPTTSASAPTPTATPTPTGTCSLRARQDWAFAQIRDSYLFPELLPASLDPAPFTSVQGYIDAIVAEARAQNKDRFFTFITSISEENAFFQSGASAGFGIRLGFDTANNRVFVIEAFEGAPALAAGIDRGTEIVAIGTTTGNLRNVSDILAAEGPGGISSALGPSDPGVTRVLRVSDGVSTRNETVSKTDFALQSVSPRYGVRVLDDGGKRVGYVNLRTFIDNSDSGLRNAFATLRAQGVTEVIIDLRYNGGGLVRIAELFGDLLGRNRFSSDVFSFTTFRPSLSSENETRFFNPQSQSIAPTKIAFIGTGSTASASELVINAMQPYLGAQVALIGTNTFGKPVGQIAIDRAACDDRLRVVAFKTENANRRGEYFNGLASTLASTCRADDDIFNPLGSPQEASIAQALSFLRGESCTPISVTTSTLGERSASSQGFLGGTVRRELITPDNPTPYQREVAGAF